VKRSQFVKDCIFLFIKKKFSLFVFENVIGSLFSFDL
jgi:hypothetical protein